jgi:uncharacterized protein (TIGR00369 family)
MQGMAIADFQRLIESELELARWLGLRAESLAGGKATVRLPFRPETVRPGGTIAGPAMMALADCAMYAAVLGLRKEAIMALTSNLTIHFLRAPKPGDLIAEAEVLRLGRRLAVIEVSVRSAGESEPVAHVTGTYALPGQGHGEGKAVP